MASPPPARADPPGARDAATGAGASAAVPPPSVAILFATLGGMGDVGKFALAAAARHTPPLRVTGIALSFDEGGAVHPDAPAAPPPAPGAPPPTGTDGGDAAAPAAAAAAAADPATTVDVAPAADAAALTAALAGTPLVRINVASAGSTAALTAALTGVDAAVAALGSRQSVYPRWSAAGTRSLVDACAAAGVRRVVALSSMGIGDDFLPPLSAVKVLWGAMLATIYRGVRADLAAAEAVWAASDGGLDYLLVRPMGLAPEEVPRGGGAVHTLTARGGGGLAMCVAKADVAAAMLAEALEPTLHRTAVTVGYRKK